MNIVFLGTGDIGLPTLRHLLQHPEHKLLAVVTQPDKPVGRRQILTPPATKVLAQENGVRVLQPEKLRRDHTSLATLDADVFVVMAYGQILPQSVLDLPRCACLNLHASLLPQHRGASPIQAAILAGDATSGITVMHMAAGLDTGDILLKKSIALSENETGGSLHDKLADLAPIALEEALRLIAAQAAPRHPQDETAATYCGKLTRAHGKIDWKQDAAAIARRIRAFDPWPGTHCYVTSPQGPKMLKIYPPTVVTNSSGIPGEVLKASGGALEIACGRGALRITEVQLDGKKRMSAREFLSGHPSVTLHLAE